MEIPDRAGIGRADLKDLAGRQLVQALFSL